MDRVFIQDGRDDENPSILVAPVGYLQNIAPDGDYEPKIVLKLENGKLLRSKMAPGTYEGMGFREYTLFLQADKPDVGIPDIPRMASARAVIEHMRHGAPGLARGARFRHGVLEAALALADSGSLRLARAWGLAPFPCVPPPGTRRCPR